MKRVPKSLQIAFLCVIAVSYLFSFDLIASPKTDFSIMEKYLLSVKDRLKQNWHVPDQNNDALKNVQTIVIVKFESDGNVSQIEFEKRSGIAELDDAAYMAIIKSIPFPPLPEGRNDYTAGYVFTPSGIP